MNCLSWAHVLLTACGGFVGAFAYRMWSAHRRQPDNVVHYQGSELIPPKHPGTKCLFHPDRFTGWAGHKWHDSRCAGCIIEDPYE